MAAEKFDAPVLANLGAAAQSDRADLAGAANVRASTGLKVYAGYFDGTKSAGALHLLANAHASKLVRCAVANGDFAVIEDDGIGGSRGAFQDLRCGLRATQVDGADGFTEMKRNGGKTETLLKDGGEQVLASVLLHMIEAARPVNAAINAAG